MKNCPLLYSGRTEPLTQSLMPFGFECGEGWKQPLKDLSYSLETLNMLFYPTDRTYIKADQVKEKFGTLRFYYHIQSESLNPFVRWIDKWTDRLFDILDPRKVDYGLKRVVDKKVWTEERIEEIPESKWLERKKYNFSADNLFKGEDGRFYVKTKVNHPEQAHREPTKNKTLWWIKTKVLPMLRTMNMTLDSAVCRDDSRQNIVINALSSLADKLIHETEKECYDVCERCGWPIGQMDDRCETLGWTTYICKKCADKGKSRYLYKDEVWQEGKVVMTKEQRLKEREEIDAKIKARDCI